MKKLMILILVLLTVIFAILIVPEKEPELVPITPTPDIGIVTPSPTKNADSSSTPFELDKEIIFTDGYLELVVRNILNKPVGSIMQSEVKTIKEINARVCAIHSIDDLVHFTSLEKLDLYGNRISDISALAGLTKLKYLNLSHNYSALNAGKGGGMNISPLKNLTALEELYLDKNSVSDISILSGLSSLKRLSLRQNRVTDISSLYRCQQLEYLDLGRNFHMGNDFKDYGIEDITVLNNLTKLTYIDISENLIEDIKPIAMLPALRIIHAADNEIADIECLRGNTTITELHIERNILFTFDVILHMDALTKISYEGNPITDYYPIDVFEGRITPSPAATSKPNINTKNSGGIK